MDNKYIKFDSKGLTLVELLVSITLTITFMTVVVSVMIASFRGASKSSVAEDIRQNGNSALTQITKQIQFANSFDDADTVDPNLDVNFGSCTTDGTIKYSSLTFTNSDDVQYVLECYDDVDLGIGVLRFGENDLINDLIDSQKATVESCSLTCTQQLDQSPVVKINFTLLNPQIDAVAEKKAKINFSKSVKMRINNQ